MAITPVVASFLVVVLAFAVAGLIGRGQAGRAQEMHRYVALEGLRGLSAIFVFLCHASAWYAQSHHRGWASDTGLFLDFGQCAVAMFFMITAFLFVGRLVDARGGSIDWLHLYVSRVLRLTPLYWVAMGLLFAVVAIVTKAGIDDAGSGIVLRSWTDIFASAAVWLGFTMLGTPAIDAYINTPLIVAGVVWSLPFEWTFYLALPLPALLLRVAMPVWALVVGLLCGLWISVWQFGHVPIVASPFLGGLVAVFAVRSAWFMRFACSTPGALVAISSLIALPVFCASPYGPLPLLLQTLFFCVVACGNTLFGLLSSRAARVLGGMSYGVYLLHGIVLYLAFMVLIGMPRAQGFTPWVHWSVVAIVLPVVLALAQACHRWVELPAMRAVRPCVEQLRRLARRPHTVPRPDVG